MILCLTNHATTCTRLAAIQRHAARRRSARIRCLAGKTVVVVVSLTAPARVSAENGEAWRPQRGPLPSLRLILCRACRAFRRAYFRCDGMRIGRVMRDDVLRRMLIGPVIL